MKTLVYTVIITICYSCVGDNLIKGKHILVKEFPRQTLLTGEKINIASIGVNDIYVVDTFLICYKAQGIDNFFDIYSTKTYQSLGTFLSPGRGPNEYLNAVYYGQYFKDTSNTYMWIQDGALMKLTLFNITASVKQNRTIIDSCIYLPDSCIGRNYIINDTLVCIVNSGPNLLLSTYNLKKDSIENRPIIIYENPYKDTKDFIFYMGIKLRPDQRKFVTALSYFNQINIFSPAYSDMTTISTYKPTLPIKQVSVLPDIERSRYYSTVLATNSSIYALYIDLPMSTWREHDKNIEIQQFSWDGDPIQKFIIPDDIIYFALDEINECIYGLKENEELYKYDLTKMEACKTIKNQNIH